MRAVVCLIVGTVAVSAAVTGRTAPAAPRAAAPDRPYGSHPGVVGYQTGTSCSAASCHGGTIGRPGGEHSSWAPERDPAGPHDPHSKAYRVLFNPESQRMAEYLKAELGGKPAHEAPLCLKCHAVDGAGPEALAEGVGCGACHGPSQKWVTEHYTPEWKALPNRVKFEQYGFVPTKNLVARVLACTTCHVGGADREVNHDLIAAGHPRLAFEYTRFHHNPDYRRHWNDTSAQDFEASVRNFEVRAWVIGQAATARQAAELLRTRAARAAGDGGSPPPGVRSTWPEFSGYSCYACHQRVGEGPVRRESSAPARPIGSLPWEPWSTSAVGVAAEAGAAGYPGAGRLPVNELNALRALMAARSPDPGTVRDRAAEVVAGLDRWLAAVQAAEDEPGLVGPIPKDVPRELAKRLAAATLVDKPEQADKDRRLRDHDWDFLAAHYLGCAAMAYAAGGPAANPGWGPAVEGLRKELRFPAAGFNSPFGFGPARLEQVRGEFDKLRK